MKRVRIASGVEVDPRQVRRVTGDRFGNIIVRMDNGVGHIATPRKGETGAQTQARVKRQLGCG